MDDDKVKRHRLSDSLVIYNLVTLCEMECAGEKSNGRCRRSSTVEEVPRMHLRTLTQLFLQKQQRARTEIDGKVTIRASVTTRDHSNPWTSSNDLLFVCVCACVCVCVLHVFAVLFQKLDFNSIFRASIWRRRIWYSTKL